MRKSVFLATLGVFLTLAQIDGANAIEKKLMNTHSTKTIEKIGKSDNVFAFKLLANVGNVKNNAVVCPLSAAGALAVVANGAAGNTQKQIISTLSSEQDLVKLSKRYHHLMNLNSLNRAGSKAPKLEIANAIFANKQIKFKDGFVNSCKREFDVEISNTDLNAVSEINKWCSIKTHGKIPTIIDGMMPPGGLVLLNAVYFSGDWLIPFDHRLTSSEKFHTRTGDVMVPMMRNVLGLNYVKEKEFALLELPYEGDRTSLFILLPDKQTDIHQFVSALTPEVWRDCRQNLSYKTVDIGLPRFKIENEFELIGALQSMGITDAFSAAAADFTALTDQKTMIDSVKQKTYLRVDEKGTEAAAVTKVSMEGTGVPPKPVPFVANHPFLAIMVDKPSEEILFMAQVVKPEG